MRKNLLLLGGGTTTLLLQSAQGLDGFNIAGEFLLGASDTQIIIRDVKISCGFRHRFGVQGFICGSGVRKGLPFTVDFCGDRQFVQFFIRCRFILPQTVLELLFVEYLIAPRISLCAGVNAHIGFADIADFSLDGFGGEVYNNGIANLVIGSFFRGDLSKFVLLLFIQFPDMGQTLASEDGLSAVSQVHILQADRLEHEVDMIYTEIPAIQLDDAADRQVIFLSQIFCLVVGAIFALSSQIDAVALGPQFFGFCCPLISRKPGNFNPAQCVFL